MTELCLDPIPEALREQAVRALDAGNALGFLCKADNLEGFALVYANARPLKERGLYEPVLLHAWVNTRTNHHHWPLADQRFLFEACDRARLLAAGDPLPDGVRFTIYRGVAGQGRARRIGGLSWTADLERARWFANRFRYHDPAVYALETARADVLAYVNWRKEHEFIVIPKRAAMKRLKVRC